jgi:hypothetical protein
MLWTQVNCASITFRITIFIPLKIFTTLVLTKTFNPMRQLFYKVCITLLAIPALSAGVFAQYDVSGTVTSSKGEELIGVTVSVKNTNNGTVTDVDGKYTIHISGGSATLVFSYVGYASQERQVTGATTVNVSLVESNTELDEVIVSGLATTVKRTNSANAVAAISAKELTGITPPTTLDAAIYGKFTGAQITQSSGAPGGGIGIRMRVSLPSMHPHNHSLLLMVCTWITLRFRQD